MAIKRQEIFDAFGSLMETITVANGFRSNIGDSVLKFRTFTPVVIKEMPAIVIGNTTEDTELTDIGRNSTTQRTLTIAYQILITGTDETDVNTEAVKAQSDVEDALRQDKDAVSPILWDFIRYVVPKDNEFGFPDKTTGDLVGVLSSSVDMKYKTNYFNPET